MLLLVCCSGDELPFQNSAFAEVPEFSEMQLMPVSHIIFFCETYSAKCHFTTCYKVICCKIFCLLNHREFAAVTYKTNKVTIIIWNRSAPMTSCGMSGITWGMIFSLGCICWIPRHGEQCFMIFICTLSCLPSILILLTIVLSSLWPCGCCVFGLVSTFIVLSVWWSSCFSCYLIYYCQVIYARSSIGECLVVLHFCSTANYLWCNALVFVDGNQSAVLLVNPLWMCM